MASDSNPLQLAPEEMRRLVHGSADAPDFPFGSLRWTRRQVHLQLLPIARRGLAEAGVEPDDSEPLLEVLAARAASGRTGATWQLRGLEAIEERLTREKALRRLLEHYLECAEDGRPVHTWPDVRG